jgi:hypothetical protein
LGTFWLKIEQFWPFEEISIFSNGGHLGYRMDPRWPPLLKIEISSNGQNCSILSQNVPKFELLKHNDELLNIYYGIARHIFGREPSNDYFIKILFLLSKWFQKRR